MKIKKSVNILNYIELFSEINYILQGLTDITEFVTSSETVLRNPTNQTIMPVENSLTECNQP